MLTSNDESSSAMQVFNRPNMETLRETLELSHTESTKSKIKTEKAITALVSRHNCIKKTGQTSFPPGNPGSLQTFQGSARFKDDKMLAMEHTASKIKPGDCIWCRVESPEPGGYNVTVVPSGLKGFLPSTHPIDLGRVVPTTFVCMDGDKALFTFAFTMGTSSRVQHSLASDEENAFSVWAEAHPKYIALRRAVDLVMPSLSASPIMLKVDEQKAKEFLPTIEQSQFTGCLKVYCESSLSRAALVFLEGRVVGSIYTKKPNRDPYTFESGIKKLVEDVLSPNTDADMEMYDLPKDIVLSMSSLFLGYVDQPSAQVDLQAYSERMLQHFATQKQTACFNLIEKKTESPIAFCFVCNGEVRGTYILGERLFGEGKEFLSKVLEKYTQARLQAHILPTAMTTASVRFGYSLGADQFAV